MNIVSTNNQKGLDRGVNYWIFLIHVYSICFLVIIMIMLIWADLNSLSLLKSAWAFTTIKVELVLALDLQQRPLKIKNLMDEYIYLLRKKYRISSKPFIWHWLDLYILRKCSLNVLDFFVRREILRYLCHEFHQHGVWPNWNLGM